MIENDKIYLNKDVNIRLIAEVLQTNKSYVSHIINDTYNKNFNSFINQYRIKEAVELLSNPDYNQYSIEGIAYEVGFNTKSSFNNAFKKETGVTPSFFKKNANISE